METSILLAKVFGILFLVVGVGMLLNGKYYLQIVREAQKNRLLVFLVSILTLVCGVIMVTYHNIWDNSWQLIITLFGVGLEL